MFRTYGFLSTYPPTQCGLATFTAALLRHLIAAAPGSEGRVVRVLAEPDPDPDVAGGTPVVCRMAPGAIEDAASSLNDCDVVVVQHEYGIYAGRDGDDVLGVLARLRVPVIVVLHTVLTAPTPGQRQVLDEVVGNADAVVTMSEAARQRLVAGYAVARPDGIVVIPHGALPAARPARRSPTDRPTILTWGLLGPGKGIEWAISALGALRDLEPRYLVAGRTHPKVLAHEGEVYREKLRDHATALGVADLVEFDPGYHEVDALAELVDRADVVLLPYDSSEQVTSGVLVEALAARKPVVATEFPHAVELLADGAGLLVPHRDQAAMTAALRRVLTEPGLAAGMSDRSARLASALGWSAVARRYRDLAEDLLTARVAVTT
ncbi:glycosyltransferase [Saccharothrix violaceirubra]|uniref:Glycosyltransferase involved in cell wall biosynthesis n=1 Tax=Saccharothrix violaceirubra TaxID=413306 RepID=A0A7W7T2R7_9PSEU|nr:glycosyltransferase [Saccharothrix violaceirubra]MBB4965542.1 glycosyltransferase involved in cell wall biosynthesis [Saccharothrix violaceirubra]